MNILHRELVRPIMGNLGMIPKSDFGKNGITAKEYLIDKALTIEYDNDDKIEHKVYAACMKNSAGKNFRAICCNLKDDLVLVFGVDGLPFHGIRLDYYSSIEDQEWVKFAVKNNKWQSLSTFDQLMACAGIEKLAQSAVQWVSCDNYEDLFEALAEVVEF